MILIPILIIIRIPIPILRIRARSLRLFEVRQEPCAVLLLVLHHGGQSGNPRATAAAVHGLPWRGGPERAEPAAAPGTTQQYGVADWGQVA